MDTSFSNKVGNHGTPISDKSGDKIRDIQQSVKDVGVSIATTVDSVVGQAKESAKQGLDTVKDVVQKTRDSVSESSEALVTYTKENPVKALMIAAASGALLWTLLKALTPSRD